MITIEDMIQDALPPSTDDQNHFHQPLKHQQIGTAAATSIVTGFFKGLQPQGRKACLLVDLTVHTTEFAKAFLVAERASSDLPLFYLGFPATKEMEWSREHLVRHLTEELLAGTCKLPDVVLPPA